MDPRYTLLLSFVGIFALGLAALGIAWLMERRPKPSPILEGLRQRPVYMPGSRFSWN